MKKCKLPPKGWRCTRGDGHNGPCAAIEATPARDRLALVLAFLAFLACFALWFARA